MEGGVEMSPADQVRAIERELIKHDPELMQKPRWLILNKSDLILEDEWEEVTQGILQELDWKDRWYRVSAIGRDGTWPIMKDVMAFFDAQREEQEAERLNEAPYQP